MDIDGTDGHDLLPIACNTNLMERETMYFRRQNLIFILLCAQYRNTINTISHTFKGLGMCLETYQKECMETGVFKKIVLFHVKCCPTNQATLSMIKCSVKNGQCFMGGNSNTVETA